MSVVFRAPLPGDAERLTENMRQADRDEVVASTGDNVLRAVRLSIGASESCKVAECDGGLLCIWGIAPLSLLSDEAAPWLLGTPAIYRHARLLTRTARGYCQDALGRYQLLANYVDARNTASIRWLRRIGFELQPPEPHGVAGLPFHRFEMRA